MQTGEIQYNNVIEEISEFFEEQLAYGKSKGVKREQFILDPGIGFGKTVEQNVEIIKRSKELQHFKLPVAIGVSRKSHLGKLLQTQLGLPTVPPPSERLEASLAETAVAVLQCVRIIRTHDVAETKRFVSILDLFKNDYD
jgi:dihydropteroate synthase